jgi:uncharacterized repeat protein (TIGR01451 family)
VTVLGEPGTELRLREHGSGSYANAETLRYLSENKSIMMNRRLEALFRPVVFLLQRNRSVRVSSCLAESARARNLITGTGMEISHSYARRLGTESHLSMDENGSKLHLRSGFEGLARLNINKQDRSRGPVFESREGYLGSFNLSEKVEEYGENVASERSAEGRGVVDVEKRIREGQKTYEGGTGLYRVEERIGTQANYLAKGINLTHSPEMFTLSPGFRINSSSRWREGMASRDDAGFLGEAYFGAKRLKKETALKGIKEMVTEADFSGMAELWALSEGREVREGYAGDFKVQRSILMAAVSRYNEPHISVRKDGRMRPGELDGKKGALAEYSITLENDGNRALGPVYIKDLFPAGAEFINASLKPDELTSGYANWTLVHLGSGETSTIQVRLNVSYAGAFLVNRVEARGRCRDGWITARNFSVIDTAWLPCCPPEVAAAKTAFIDQADPSVVRYSIMVRNLGDRKMVVRIEDSPPDTMRLLSASPRSEAGGPGSLSWILDELSPGEARTIEYRGRYTKTGLFLNSAHLEGYSLDGSGFTSADISALIAISAPAPKGTSGCSGWEPPAWGFCPSKGACEEV